MKKVLGSMAGIFITVFSLAILGLLMTFTFGALKILFPDNFANQIWGLVLFDIAAMVWALAFVFKSESVLQYATAGIGFITAFAGTLLMVSADVILSGQTFVQDNSIGRFMVYGFIIVTAIHAALIYAHHAGSPDIHQKINIGIAQGEITTEAIRQATTTLDEQKAALAYHIHAGMVEQVKRDLNLPIAVDPEVGFVPAQQTQIPYPVQTEQPTKKETWFDRLKNTVKPSKSQTIKNEQVIVDVPKLEEQAGAPDNYGPKWKASTDIGPTLDGYAWECTCGGSNPAHSRTCQWCKRQRTNGDPVTAFSNTPPASQEEPKPGPDAPFQSGS